MVRISEFVHLCPALCPNGPRKGRDPLSHKGSAPNEPHVAKVRVASSNLVVRSIEVQVRGPLTRASVASKAPRSTQTLYH